MKINTNLLISGLGLVTTFVFYTYQCMRIHNIINFVEKIPLSVTLDSQLVFVEKVPLATIQLQQPIDYVDNVLLSDTL